MGASDPATVDPANETAIKELASRVGALSVGLKEVTEIVKGLKDEGVVRGEVDGLVQKYEEIRGTIETVQKAIKTRQTPMFVPGLEDEAEKFNLLRLIVGVKEGNPEKVAPFEMEVCKAARDAFERSLRPKMRGHVMWDDSAGGLWVPDQVLSDVIAPIYTRSVFINLSDASAESGTTRVSVIDGLVGNPVKFPEFEGGTLAYFIGEEDDYIESQTKSGNRTMTPKKLGILTRITEEMANLASPAFDRFLRQDMIRAAAKKIDHSIMYGPGTSSAPLGLANDTLVPKFWAENYATGGAAPATPAGAEATFDVLMEAQGSLEDSDIAFDDTYAWISHPRYWRRLKQLKILNYDAQAVGNPYLLGGPFISNERLQSIIGEFDGSTQIPTTKAYTGGSKFTDIFYGNFGEVIFGRWGGLQILDDGGTGTGFIRDQTYIKLRMWCDHVVRQGKALRHIPDAQARN